MKTTAAQVESARASIQVNQATVQQYADLQLFEKIVAPFSGVITLRNVDPGVLVTADNPSETRPLFHLMQTDTLRVFVNVPQVYATAVTAGQRAVVYRKEDPGRRFPGKMARTAAALDPNTHAADPSRCAQSRRRPAAGNVLASAVRRRPRRAGRADPQALRW